MNKGDISNIVATLVTNGFHIEKTDRFPDENLILNIKKFDKLGAEIRYSILFSKSLNETGITSSLLTIATSYSSKPLIINDTYSSVRCKTYSFKDFYDFFGGIVNTGLILIPNLPDLLNELGRNQLPALLQGEPFDLHELYVKECLQFILQSPTRRYGKDRLFEALPDGVVICKNKTMILYDSKAYKSGFNLEADDIKRFASYVQEFNKRYSAVLGNVFTFLIITGKLNCSEKSLSSRSKELYKKCFCTLSSITSRSLGEIVHMLQNEPEIRSSILWENIFSDLIITPTQIQTEINRIKKDKIS